MKRYLAASLLCCLPACERHERQTTASHGEIVDLAREAALETFAMLSAELAAAIADGGPVAAIPVCAQRAGEITSEVAEKRNLGIVRLSDRPRNPAQEAQGDDLAVIDEFRAQMDAGNEPAPHVGEAADGGAVVRLPIVISQPLCLQCHGGENEIAGATSEAILKSYPDDRARGYMLNDLRGIWKITIPADHGR